MSANPTPSIRRVIALCTECGCETVIDLKVGTVNRMGIEHHDDCEFYQAIERDEGHDWVSRRGYPISMRTPS